MPKDPPDKGTPSDDTDWKTEAEKWKKLARQHEDRAKANHDELEQLKKSGKDDEEKVNDRIAELERKAEEADARALRAEVASEKGLTAKQAKRLQGKTREELEADADDLLESFPSKPSEGEEEEPKGGKPTGGQGPPTQKPKPDLRGGSDPTEEPKVDTAKALESIPRL